MDHSIKLYINLNLNQNLGKNVFSLKIIDDWNELAI